MVSMDEQTKKLFLSISTGEDEDGYVTYDHEKILSAEFSDYDPYRIFSTILESQVNDDSGTFGELKRDVSMFQLNLLKNEAKMFTMAPEIKHLLELTKPAKIEQELKMPFLNLFLNTDYCFKEEGIRVFGALIMFFDKEKYKEINNKYKEIIRENPCQEEANVAGVSCLVYVKKYNNFRIVDLSINLSTGELEESIKIKEVEHEPYEKFIKKVMRDRILNLLLFLNEPRLTTYVQNTNQAIRRKRGLIPIPALLKTRIEIGLKEYIDKVYLSGQSNSKLGYSYWVRGHWRTFRSHRYVNKRGQKAWIMPHLAGEGIRPPQIFEVALSKKEMEVASGKQQ